MLRIALARLHQGHRTMKYPAGPPPPLPDRLRGRPIMNRSQCPADCRLCAAACPTDAIDFSGPAPRIDLGKCLGCDDCRRACPHQAIACNQEYGLATGKRQDLVYAVGEPLRRACVLEHLRLTLYHRALRLRQVSAAGCNACEADTNVLNTLAWDLGRFGIQFVASPRHADGLLVTGPISKNMELALRKTWDATPEPRVLIACGACAISGGPYAGHPEVLDGIGDKLPVDLYIPGCPPHPLTILEGLLQLLGIVKA